MIIRLKASRRLCPQNQPPFLQYFTISGKCTWIYSSRRPISLHRVRSLRAHNMRAKRGENRRTDGRHLFERVNYLGFRFLKPVTSPEEFTHPRKIFRNPFAIRDYPDLSRLNFSLVCELSSSDLHPAADCRKLPISSLGGPASLAPIVPLFCPAQTGFSEKKKLRKTRQGFLGLLQSAR